MDPAPYVDEPVQPPEWTWQPRPKFQDRVWRHVILFALTVVMTTIVGSLHYESFASDFTNATVDEPLLLHLAHGLWYSLTVLAILGCHEMGHYFACRYYDVDASLPFFLPAPILTGTFGAFIRIREPIPAKSMLFDIGIAGPIAGFVVAVPAVFLGVAMSRVVPLPPIDQLGGGFELGEPLLFKFASWVFWGAQPSGYTLNMHPVAFAGWFGLIATSINLAPIGQLDGGHISYAVLGRRSWMVTLAGVAMAVVLAWLSPSWILWTVILILMLYAFGLHHPRTADEDQPLDTVRLVLAIFAIVMFALCFTPFPMSAIKLINP